MILLLKMPAIIKPKNVQLSDITFSDVKINKFGGKSVYLNHNEGQLWIQIPEMTIPWGTNKDEIKDSKTGETTGYKYSLALSFRGCEEKADLKEFQSVLESIDELMVQSAKDNSLSWLKQKSTSLDVTRALYCSTLKKSKDPETGEPDGRYPDTFKGKLRHYDGNFVTEVFSKDKEVISDIEAALVKGTKLKSILKCTGLWFAAGKFGLSWEFAQIRVTSSQQKITGYSFISDSDDEDDDDVVVEQNDSIDSKNETQEEESDDDLDNGVEVDEDDDDDDDDDAPPKKVKVVRKKKVVKK